MEFCQSEKVGTLLEAQQCFFFNLCKCSSCGYDALQLTSFRPLIILYTDRIPTRTGKMGRHFPVREKSGTLNRLEKSENT